MIIDDHQSRFSAEQAALQMPPELDPALRPPQTATTKTRNPHKTLLMIAGGVLGGILLLSIIVRVFLYRPVVTETAPSPSPTPVVQQMSSTQQALQELEDQVDGANPQNYSFPPPPVDMQVTF